MMYMYTVFVGILLGKQREGKRCFPYWCPLICTAPAVCRDKRVTGAKMKEKGGGNGEKNNKERGLNTLWRRKKDRDMQRERERYMCTCKHYSCFLVSNMTLEWKPFIISPSLYDINLCMHSAYVASFLTILVLVAMSVYSCTCVCGCYYITMLCIFIYIVNEGIGKEVVPWY